MEVHEEHKMLVASFMGKPFPSVPELKTFKAKSKNLPILGKYPRKLPAAY